VQTKMARKLGSLETAMLDNLSLEIQGKKGAQN
jgi:hypothetical protein